MSEIRNHRNHSNFRPMTIRIAMLSCLCASIAVGKQVHEANEKVEGAVVVRDSEGRLSSGPFAKVSLSGMGVSETGSVDFSAVPAQPLKLLHFKSPRR